MKSQNLDHQDPPPDATRRKVIRFICVLSLVGFLIALYPQKAIPSSDEYERGVSAYMKRDYKTAQSAFESYLKKNPDHTPTKLWIEILDSILVEDKPTGQKKKSPVSTRTKKIPQPSTTSRAIKETQSLSRQVNELTEDKNQLRKQISRKETETTNLQVLYKKSQENVKSLEQRLKSQAKKDRALRKARTSQISEELRTNQLAASEFQAKYQSHQKTINELYEENETLKNQLENLKKKSHSEYQAQLSQLKEVSRFLSETDRKDK